MKELLKLSLWISLIIMSFYAGISQGYIKAQTELMSKATILISSTK